MIATPANYLIERKQPLYFSSKGMISSRGKSVALIKSAQEVMSPERMVLGDKTNMAAWASSFSEVRISDFQDEIFL